MTPQEVAHQLTDWLTYDSAGNVASVSEIFEAHGWVEPSPGIYRPHDAFFFGSEL